MRKNYKVKAGFLLFSWVMIFTHGIIPHNHIDADYFHAGFIHPAPDHHNNSDGLPEFRELCNDFESCRISNILFQKISNDENPVLPEDRLYVYHSINSLQVLVEFNQQIPDKILPGSVLLRAPPAA